MYRGGPAHRYPSSGGVRVTKLAVGAYDTNVYVIASEDEAIVVDAAAEAERILTELEGLKLVGIVQTHNHSDHVQALPGLVQATGAAVYAHPDDPVSVPALPLADGDVLVAGSAEVAVFHTPGHTPGSVSFLVGDTVFTGDTLFPGGPGNTNGDAARFAEIMRSLEGLFALPDETRVCPGHGLDTTIGRERPYVEIWRDRGW